MSEPKLISPLLDGFMMGESISDHNGVRCYPAIKENSDSKYIVKIISVPASQVQLDAFLLTGAYKDPAEAMDYFKALSDDIVKEAKILRKLSKREGFLTYEGCQVVPMEENELGYLIYLVSEYRQSVEKFCRRNSMTHLGAVNLGLDMCAALAICRRAGRIYVDLKPSNIFITEDKGYRIGDLGFADLANLKYTSLPAKYQSAYSAPELLDPMNTLNTTADIYALGMILYQIYNNGQLPTLETGSDEPMPTPDNADYEMAEIIMKAIAADPDSRWQDPLEMGQALVAYMQRNAVNDVPITPPSADLPEEVEEADGEDGEAEPVVDDSVPGEEDIPASTYRMSDETVSMLDQADELLQAVPILVTEEEPEPKPEADGESAPDAEAEKPAAVAVAPVKEPAAKPAKAKPAPKAAPAKTEAPKAESPAPERKPESKPEKNTHKSGKGWIVAVVILLVLALLAVGGYGFYKHYYQQSVRGLTVQPYEDQATVVVDTEIDPALLTVICTDIYGSSQSLPLVNGQAVFTGLLPDTQYKIQLEITGFHELIGSTSTTFATPALTTISNFSATTGNEDGSVILTFDTTGLATEDWIIKYSAPEEETQSVSFSGTTVIINGLTVGKTYSFELLPAAELYMDGENTLEFTASAILLASDLTIADLSDNTMTVSWTAPEDATVETWLVRCYSDDGTMETLETSETTASFPNIDATKAYTVEVTAKGMTQSVRAHMTANPAVITGLNVNANDPAKLEIRWNFEGNAPEGGWIVLYSIDGRETKEVLRCDEPVAVISPKIPGATYHLTIQAANGSYIFNNKQSYTVAEAEKFYDSRYQFKSDYSTYSLCNTPTKENLKLNDLKKLGSATSFKLEKPISIVIKSVGHYLMGGNVDVLYVIRDAEGNVITELTAEEQINWDKFWTGRYPYGILNIPKVPTETGTYTLHLYFNYNAVTSIEFTVSE